MIETLKIRNFGPHKKLNVEFDSTVTTIVGKSYAGKSALIRALRWACRNSPAGNSFINWDSDKASIQLTVDDNKIIRRKGSVINQYKLNKKPFKAFKNNVPPEIAKVLNLSDINFQKQMTLPFWFAETAGEVSRQLNSIVNLEVIDKTLAHIVSLSNTNNTTIKVTKQRIKNIKEQRESLAYVEKMDKDCKKLELLQTLYDKNAVKCSTTSDIIKSVRLYRSKRDNLLESSIAGKLAISMGNKYKKIANRMESLQDLTIKIRNTNKIIKSRPPSLLPHKKIKNE